MGNITIKRRELDTLRKKVKLAYEIKNEKGNTLECKASLSKYTDIVKKINNSVTRKGLTPMCSEPLMRKLFYYTPRESKEEFTFRTDFIDTCYLFVTDNVMNRGEYVTDLLSKTKREEDEENEVKEIEIKKFLSCRRASISTVLFLLLILLYSLSCISIKTYFSPNDIYLCDYNRSAIDNAKSVIVQKMVSEIPFFGKNGSNNGWACAQVLFAIKNEKANQAFETVIKSEYDFLKPGWKSNPMKYGRDSFDYRATPWVILSSLENLEKLPNEETLTKIIPQIITNQTNEGAWSAFYTHNLKSNDFHESSYATCINLIMLQKLLDSQFLVENQTLSNEIRSAIDKGKQWIFEHYDANENLWRDYPNHPKRSTTSYAISGLAIYTLNLLNHPKISEYNRLWVNEITRKDCEIYPEYPEISDVKYYENWNSISSFKKDATKYYKLPWAIISMKFIYPKMQFSEQVTINKWTNKTLAKLKHENFNHKSNGAKSIFIVENALILTALNDLDNSRRFNK